MKLNAGMDDKVDSERQVVVEGEFRNLLHIDPNRARFPCCIVWTPLPVISWLIPFIGHIGICREDGVILDFAGPNFVCVDNFAFGSVARYVQINMKKVNLSCFVFFSLDLTEAIFHLIPELVLDIIQKHIGCVLNFQLFYLV